MDAFDIALLMANQHADGPMRMRYGTVVGACDESVLSVVPDGQESPVPAVKCCLPVEGSRVVLLVPHQIHAENSWIEAGITSQT